MHHNTRHLVQRTGQAQENVADEAKDARAQDIREESARDQFEIWHAARSLLGIELRRLLDELNGSVLERGQEHVIRLTQSTSSD